MLIIEVDKENVNILVEGKSARVNAELAIAIKAFHDSVVKNASPIYKNLAHITAVESVKMALNLISD